ncbi:MAG: hypothetical protein LBK26_00895 [Rickettsiales bacterium]|nr:hypothetical protein [Rickettsiales bacterium]
MTNAPLVQFVYVPLPDQEQSPAPDPSHVALAQVTLHAVIALLLLLVDVPDAPLKLGHWVHDDELP